MSYSNLSGQRRMALDHVRNDAYARALREVITPDSVVLDVGAGVGIHGLMAARLGARKVYLVEQEEIIAIAAQNVRANGFEGVVECIHSRLEDVTLPEKVDVIVSALTGNFLLTEDLLPVLFLARDRFLKPGGALLPSAATMEVAPVHAPRLHEREIESWSQPEQGVDLSPGREYAANMVLYTRDDLEPARELGPAATLHTMDLMTSRYESVKAEAAVRVAETADCHGWSGWFSIKLGDQWLSTSHRAPKVHWTPIYLPLDPPMAVTEGETLTLTLWRAPFGDWTWKTTATSGSQRRSTMLGAPMKADTLAKAALDYKPLLTSEGQAVAQVLARCDGSGTVMQIAADLHAAFPTRYASSDDALRFVQALVKRNA